MKTERTTLVQRIRWLFCRHPNYEFVRNIYGDEIILRGWKRSIYRCEICGHYIFKDELRESSPKTRADAMEDSLLHIMAQVSTDVKETKRYDEWATLVMALAPFNMQPDVILIGILRFSYRMRGAIQEDYDKWYGAVEYVLRARKVNVKHVLRGLK